MPVVGRYEDLGKFIGRTDLDQIVVALPLEDHQLLPGIMAQLKDSIVDIKIVPDLYQFASLGGAIEEFEGLPVISLQECPLDGINLFTKRVVDIVMGSAILLLFSPLMALIAALVKITSRGPILFKQERVSFGARDLMIDHSQSLECCRLQLVVRKRLRRQIRDAAAHAPRLRLERAQLRRDRVVVVDGRRHGHRGHHHHHGGEGMRAVPHDAPAPVPSQVGFLSLSPSLPLTLSVPLG